MSERIGMGLERGKGWIDGDISNLRDQGWEEHRAKRDGLMVLFQVYGWDMG